MTASTCKCMTPSPPYPEFEHVWLGKDTTQGRFGRVTIETCKECNRIWLCYEVEYPAFSKSGRWYRGIVSPSVARTATPESAVAILEGLDWYLYGGSYFESRGTRGSGTVYVGL